MFIDTNLETISAPRVASAKLLGLTQAELDALLKVRDMLATGLMTYDAEAKCDKDFGFNMGVWKEDFLRENKQGCGTIGCIGGWMDFFLGQRSRGISGLAHGRPHMYRLFAPERTAWVSITPSQAVQAIDNFTIHSPRDAGWYSILEPHQRY